MTATTLSVPKRAEVIASIVDIANRWTVDWAPRNPLDEETASTTFA